MISTEIANASKIMIGSTLASAMYIGSEKLWPVEDYSKEYLTFTAVEDGTFTFTGKTVNNVTNSLSYSLDGGITWIVLASGVASPTVQAGNKIYWRGSCLINNSSNTGGIGKFSSTNIFDVSGNPMSLYYGSNFKGITSIPAYIFISLFYGCNKLRNAVNLSLSATTLAPYCYQLMFSLCKGLTTAPVLPATTLAKGCYRNMFLFCSSLTTAPALPATTLALECYTYMFLNCTSLTTAPALPATTLATYCYLYMFYGCTALTTAPALPATTLASYCYYQMFYGCTGLTTAPVLPATTLELCCYLQMFYACRNLNYIKAMFTTTPSDTYTKQWVWVVKDSGTFVKNSAATWDVTGTNGIPSGWTVLTSSS